MPALKFPKSWLRTLGYRPKIHHFFFSHKWDTRFKYLSKLCPYILMYSALHIMQWFSHSLDVFTPKIKRKFFDFYILWIKTNVAYTRLEMIARTKHCTTTTASNWFVTLYYKLLPAVRSPSKHGRWRSSLLLYSISMVYTSFLGCIHPVSWGNLHGCTLMALLNWYQLAGGAGKARFNVATPTNEARTRPLHVQHTYYRIIFKQNQFNIISRGVQRWTSTDFRLK